jgi:hypothetical protein
MQLRRRLAWKATIPAIATTDPTPPFAAIVRMALLREEIRHGGASTPSRGSRRVTQFESWVLPAAWALPKEDRRGCNPPQ